MSSLLGFLGALGNSLGVGNQDQPNALQRLNNDADPVAAAQRQEAIAQQSALAALAQNRANGVTNPMANLNTVGQYLPQYAQAAADSAAKNAMFGIHYANAFGKAPPNYNQVNNGLDQTSNDQSITSTDLAPIQPGYNNTSSQSTSSSPQETMPNQPPVQNAGETVKAYQARLRAWQASPRNIALQSDARVSPAETIKGSDDLAKQALAAHGMITTLNVLEDATNQFQSGATADAKTTLARYAKAFGYKLSPEDEASLDNKQVFTKVANELIGQAAKAEGGASRLQSAFNAIKNSNPNTAMEPNSLHTIIGYMRQKAQVPIDMQEQWAQTRSSNPNARFNDFQTNYVSNLNKAQSQRNYTPDNTANDPVAKAKSLGYTDAEIQAYLAKKKGGK